jgi:predicted N-formylglutamate amidohydrolase
MTTPRHPALLGPGDPAPVVVVNPARHSPFLLIGDHAGLAIPSALGSLGLSSQDLARHIACDIGVRGLGEAMAQLLDATFLHQVYSRLVIDCNRDPQSAEICPVESDGTHIPGNDGLGAAARAERIAAIHDPYHRAIAEEIARRLAAGLPVVLVSLHSFTPVMGGHARPWHVGVLHAGGTEVFALAVMAALQAAGAFVVGDNEPYHMDATDHTVPRHAFDLGLDYVELEIRQDLIARASGQREWARTLADALGAGWALRQDGNGDGPNFRDIPDRLC